MPVLDRTKALIGATLLAVAVMLVWQPPSAHAVEAPRVETFDGPYYLAYLMTTPLAGCSGSGDRLVLGDLGGTVGTAAYISDGCAGTERGGLIIVPDSTTLTVNVFKASAGTSMDCEFYSAPPGGSGTLRRQLTGTGTTLSSFTLTTTPGTPVQVHVSSFAGHGQCGFTDIGVVRDPAATGGTGLGTAPTTTTTTSTTIFVPEDPAYEEFTTPPFRVEQELPTDYQPFGWSQELGYLFTQTDGSDYQRAGLSFVPAETTATVDVGGAGFNPSGGCEVYYGQVTTPGELPTLLKWTGKKIRSGFTRVDLVDLVPGARYFLKIGLNPPVTDSSTPAVCAVDHIGPLSATEGTDEWESEAPTGEYPEGPATTGDDGLDDCVPSGWSLVNPFAYIGGIGCALKWAFLPSADTFSVDDLRDAAEDRVPFSWLDSMVDVGPAFADHVRNPNYGQDGGATCGVTMGYQDGLEDSFGIDTPNDFDHDAFPTTPSGETGCFGGSDSPTSPLVNQWAPRVKAAFKLMIWIVLGSRLLMMAPWSKGRDGGEPA